MATPGDTAYHFINHKWNCQRDFLSFLFFFLFNNGALFFWAIWSHCRTPVNFRALELLSGPPLVRIHSFVLFSAVCWLLALRGVGELGHCQRLWKIIQWWSQHTQSQHNRHKQETPAWSALCRFDRSDLCMVVGLWGGEEKCELWNLIDCLSFIWPFTPPLCNMVLLSPFVIDYMNAFAWIWDQHTWVLFAGRLLQQANKTRDYGSLFSPHNVTVSCTGCFEKVLLQPFFKAGFISAHCTLGTLYFVLHDSS